VPFPDRPKKERKKPLQPSGEKREKTNEAGVHELLTEKGRKGVASAEQQQNNQFLPRCCRCGKQRQTEIVTPGKLGWKGKGERISPPSLGKNVWFNSEKEEKYLKRVGVRKRGERLRELTIY